VDAAKFLSVLFGCVTPPPPRKACDDYCLVNMGGSDLS
jgi:hypothetical protein